MVMFLACDRLAPRGRSPHCKAHQCRWEQRRWEQRRWESQGRRTAGACSRFGSLLGGAAQAL